MKGFAGNTRPRERCVLVLRGESAIWSLWRAGRCVDERREPIERLAANGCPWPADDAERLVEVVADSPLDEVESIMLAASDVAGDRALGAWRRWLLRMRLLRHHPEALVRMASPRVTPFVASLSRAELPGEWRRHLEALQRGPLTVRSLHSALWLDEPFDALGTATHAAGDVLDITCGVGIERHTLYRGGCPAFTRVVVSDDNAAADTSALGETLAHLAATYGVSEPRVQRREAGDVVARLAREALRARGRHRTRRDAGDRLFDKRRSFEELRRLWVITLFTALIACATVLAATVHGLHSARLRARDAAAAAAVATHVEALRASVAARHADPGHAVASLALIDAYEAAASPDGQAVLDLLADVLTAHPYVRLERLVWSTHPPGEPGEWRADETPSIGGAMGRTLRSLPRTPEDGHRSGATIELAGRIASAASADAGLVIGERQRRFEAFVAALRARVDALHVALSPATAASLVGDGRAPALDYELRLHYPAPGRG